MSFVSVTNVTKAFGDNVVLRDVDLAVEEHNVVCLIGASGSGKSTLLRCLNLLEGVDEGEIVVDGQTITNGHVDVNALRRKIGIVFQAYNLFPHMTVLDNVTLAPTKVRRVGKSDARERTADTYSFYADLSQFGQTHLNAGQAHDEPGIGDHPGLLPGLEHGPGCVVRHQAAAQQ